VSTVFHVAAVVMVAIAIAIAVATVIAITHCLVSRWGRKQSQWTFSRG
jgi:hypothetical protein